jgi:CRISPR-associated protein Csm2
MARGNRNKKGRAWVDATLAKIPDIIEKDEMVQVLVDQANHIAEEVHHDVTTSQLRNIFGPVRNIQLKWRKDSSEEEAVQSFREVMLLRPKLAYQAKRANKSGFYDLEKVLSTAIEEIGKTDDIEERYERFRRFVDFFEAILAYHTYYGGK